MTGSLIIGPFDVLAESSGVQLMSDDLDYGAPAADTSMVSRILLDGDVVSGDRSGNRTITLRLLVQTGSLQTDVAAIGQLYETVNQQTWTMLWTPDGLSSVMFDCYRSEVVQSWSDMLPDYRFVTLTIPAEPFTRDAVPTVLVPPSSSSTVVLDALDSVTGLSTSPAAVCDDRYGETNVTQSGTTSVYKILDAAVNGDVSAASLAPDVASNPPGTAGAVRVTAPIALFTIPGTYGSLDGHRLAAPTVARTFTAPVNLSALSQVSWLSRLPASSGPAATTSLVGVNVTSIGIDASVQDPASLGASIISGSWVLRLVDTSGRAASWVVTQLPGTSWTPVSGVDLQTVPDVADPGFDLTQVASYRLRCYLLDGVYPDAGGSSLELYSTGVATVNGANPVNLGSGLTPAVPSAFRPLADTEDACYLVAPQASGTVELSWGTSVPVTAGQTYSGRCEIRSDSSSAQSTSAIPGGMTSVTTQAGIEWLNSSGTVLSTSWGAVAPVATEAAFVGAGSQTIVRAEPVVTAAVAPTGATAARVRYRALNTTPSMLLLWFRAPRIVAGATAWRFPYATWPSTERSAFMDAGSTPPLAVALGVSTLVASHGNQGIRLTGSYGVATFTDIEGVARTPVALQVTATAGTPSALLLARTPKPRPGWNPFLVPTGVTLTGGTVTLTADATALSGKSAALGGNDSVVAVRSASSFDGTYAVLARVKVGSGAGATISASAQLSSDATVVATCGPVTIPGAAGSGWQWVTLGLLTLPPRAIAATNTATGVVITVRANTGSPLIDVGVLTDLAGEALFVNGMSGTRFWLDTPDSDDYTGTIYAGTAADRSDALSCAPFQTGQAVMLFNPGNNSLTVLMDQAGSIDVTLTYAPKWVGEHP